jgi:hypothetical protein
VNIIFWQEIIFRADNLDRLFMSGYINLLPGSKWIAQADEDTPQSLDWDAWLGPAPFKPYNPGLLKGWIYYYDYCPGFLDDAVHQFDLATHGTG